MPRRTAHTRMRTRGWPIPNPSRPGPTPADTTAPNFPTVIPAKARRHLLYRKRKKQVPAFAGITRTITETKTPMFFRNLTLFRFPENLPRSLKKLSSFLDENRLKPCRPSELATRGFVSPFGRDSEELSHQIGAFILITIGGEERLLPSVVVNEELAARL